jgi:hypothetical protein
MLHVRCACATAQHRRPVSGDYVTDKGKWGAVFSAHLISDANAMNTRTHFSVRGN